MATKTHTSPRTRSFGGCSTCRSRHMKCDERRPKCSNCIAYNLECDGYVRNIFFDSDSSGDEDGQIRYRQLLFTDTERHEMNVQMTSVVPLSRTQTTISAIDQACEISLQDKFEVQRGPFGAFRLGTINEEIAEIPRIPSPSLSMILRISPVASPNLDFDNQFFPEWIPTTSAFDLDISMSPFFTDDSDMGNDLILKPCNWLATRRLSTPSTFNLDEAPVLLKHYADNIISSLTPFRHTKTPWHVLFLPSAKHTLAGLVMNEEVDDASLTIFYGILAISALDLQYTSCDGRWGATFLELKAQQCLSNVLQQALATKKLFKYKAMVMAILVMIELSVSV